MTDPMRRRGPPAYRVRPAQPGDAARLAPVMRAADRAEMRALGGFTPLAALDISLANSGEAHAVELACGHVAALFGVGVFAGAPDVGAPWLLGSDRLLELRRPVLRRARAWVDRLGRDVALLANIVDARNRAHIRWLDWAGFTFLRRLPEFGPERRPFLEFVRLTPTQSTDRGEPHVRSQHDPDHAAVGGENFRRLQPAERHRARAAAPAAAARH